jgi:hypothetical protein
VSEWVIIIRRVAHVSYCETQSGDGAGQKASFPCSFPVEATTTTTILLRILYGISSVVVFIKNPDENHLSFSLLQTRTCQINDTKPKMQFL